MKGKYRIVVQNKRIRYDFEIRRNLTVIRGESATGKTTLIEMIREYYENQTDSGIQLDCEKECTILSGRNWKAELTLMKDSIIFIDEGNEFVFTDEFAAVIQNTDNYYVIVTRESISSLPYSVTEVYGIRNAGKYGTLRKTYNEFFHLYSLADYQNNVKPTKIITEDSNSGYYFFEKISTQNSITCISANGKSNIFSTVVNMHKSDLEGTVLIIADGAAFGAEMEKMNYLIRNYEGIVLCLPESFEWMILSSGILDDKELREVLTKPEEYIESKVFFSWERFFATLLVAKTENTYLRYTKRALNPAYLSEKNMNKILNVISRVQFN